jgi:rhodanese-related sulfurtransferase
MSWLHRHVPAGAPTPWPRALRHVAVLVLVPSLLALLGNAIRPDRLPWISLTDYRDAILVPCPEHLVEAVAITLDDLPRELDGWLVLDARTRGEYLAGHVPGAVSAPWDPFAGLAATAELPPEVRALDGASSRRVVVCGDARVGSGRALASHLRERGLDDVAYLDGGCSAWFDAGRAVERSGDAVVRLSPGELAAELDGWTVVDARFSRSFRRGHLPGALSMPYRMLDGLGDERLAPLRDVSGARLLVYGSADGGEGEALARLLASGPWPGTAWLDGGYEAWAEAHPAAVAVDGGEP